MLSISPNALQQIHIAIQQADAKGVGLRIAAKLADDRSIQYALGFDELNPEDQATVIDGIPVLIDSLSRPLLDEAILDYVELESSDFQFVFLNPLDPHYVPPAATPPGSD